jgi:hypothetical protein
MADEETELSQFQDYYWIIGLLIVHYLLRQLTVPEVLEGFLAIQGADLSVCCPPSAFRSERKQDQLNEQPT